MKLFKLKKSFINDESGAVTVDWVVITASLTLLGGTIVASVGGGLDDLASDVSTELSSVSVS